MFAADFFQIPTRDGHPCLSGYAVPTTRACSGLAPVSRYTCWSNKKLNPEIILRISCICLSAPPIISLKAVDIHELIILLIMKKNAVSN